MLTDPVVRKLIAQKFAAVIDGFVSERSGGILQEPQLTSRLGQRIEDVFDGAAFSDYRVKAITEDIPDRGPNSMEKRTGADLYMGIEVDDGPHTVTKGIFIQAKWKDGDWGAAACSELAEQSRKMMRRSQQGSFVFLYGPDGVDVVTARDCTLYPHRVPKLQPLQSVEHFFEDILVCRRGDPAYGVPPAGDMRAELKKRLERYGAKTGVLIDFIRRGDRSPRLADRRIWNTKRF